MDSATSILIIAGPGRDRQSLAALLKTLRCSKLFLSDGNIPGLSNIPTPEVVLVDLGVLGRMGEEALARAARQWPAARRLALVDDFRLIEKAQSLGAHYALTRNTSAGELLSVVQRMCTGTSAALKTTLYTPISATS